MHQDSQRGSFKGNDTQREFQVAFPDLLTGLRLQPEQDKHEY
jgi:hypothetical protein